MYKILSGLTLVIAIQVIAERGFAFGTVNIMGQNAEHEKITRLALKEFGLGPLTMGLIAGRNGTFGAVGAPDRPDRGLLFTQAAHCDGGDWLKINGYPHAARDAAQKLANCRHWIFEKLRAAVRYTGELIGKDGRPKVRLLRVRDGCAFDGKSDVGKCKIIEAIGLAFHAAQDFYSHTNWTDIRASGPISLTNPPGLEANKAAGWIDPRIDGAMPRGLISGCFDGVPEWLFCKGRVRHSVINKDTGRIDLGSGSIGSGTTTRGKVNGNFARAVKAAIEDTTNKWAYFEDMILRRHADVRGKKIVCLMRNDSASKC